MAKSKSMEDNLKEAISCTILLYLLFIIIQTITRQSPSFNGWPLYVAAFAGVLWYFKNILFPTKSKN